MIPTTLLLFALVATVSAHGFVKEVTLNGQVYTGPFPSSGQGGLVRQIQNTNPNTDPYSDAIVCGLNSQRSTESPEVAAGSQVEFFWDGGDGYSFWPHNSGPLLTYMAKCDGDCTQLGVDALKQLQFFKISQEGQDGSGAWAAQSSLMNGATAKTTIPSDIAPGNYVIRHEIISLHLADNSYGAEYYPSCSTVTVTGSGNAIPSDTVTFPGAYNPEDPGIHVNIWSMRGDYVFPGPAVYTPGSGGSNGGGGNSPASPFSSSSAGSRPSSTDAQFDDAVPTATEGTASPSVSAPAQSDSTTCNVGSYRRGRGGWGRNQHRRRRLPRSAAPEPAAAAAPEAHNGRRRLPLVH